MNLLSHKILSVLERSQPCTRFLEWLFASLTCQSHHHPSVSSVLQCLFLKELCNQVFGILLVRLFLWVLRRSCSTLLFLTCFWVFPVINVFKEEGRFCSVLNKKDKSDAVQASALKICPFVSSDLFLNTQLYLSLNNGLTTLLVI